MKKLLIATHNPAKLRDMSDTLKPLTEKGLQILSLSDLNIEDDPEETGKTFLDNAKLKAEFYGNLTGLPTISDDGGLIIDILNGEPGVKSKRWLGRDAKDEELIEYAFKRLEGISSEKRTAQFTTCLYFYDPETKNYFYEIESIAGRIADKPAIQPTPGYPYRSLFVVQKYNKLYDHLTNEEHEDINHRLKALKRISEKIKKYLLE